MGIFDKTPEEKKKEEEKRQLAELKEQITYSNVLESEAYKVLINYIDGIKNKTNINDFFEIDFLIRVMVQLVDQEFDQYDKMSEHLNKIINVVHDLLPAGMKTPGYDFLKEMIINNFVSATGYINYGIFQREFYSLFDDKKEYLDIMNIITSNDGFIRNFNVISNYACKVGKYCTSKEIFHADIVSFIHGLKDVVDKDYFNYIDECIEEAQKRIGVYSVSEKELALCNSNVERMESYVDQIIVYKERLEQEKKQLSLLIDQGVTSITTASKNAIEEYQKLIEEEKVLLAQKLDDYLLELEASLKERSDEVFKEILTTYQKQIRDFRTMFQGYSKATAADLLKIQKATEESVEQLRNYVTSDANLQEILAKANESNIVREKIVQLVEREEELAERGIEIPKDIPKSTNTFLVPGYDKFFVPASPEVVIPNQGDVSKYISAFDETIDFNERLEKILQKMEEKEKNGVFYHEKTVQIIRDIMEGDWPYLWGPSGCGKSYLMTQIADLLEIDLVKNSKITEPYTIMGYNDSQGRFRATQTFIALMYGKLLAFDEFDNGNPDTQVILNEVYSGLLDTLEHPDKGSYVTFAEDMPVKVHPNFRMISAGNTCGEGENTLFSSRGKIDESVQERMTPIFVNYDNRLEKGIFGTNKEWYDFFVNFRKACDKYAADNGLDSAPGIGTTRDAASICKYVRNNSKTLDQVIEEKFVQTKNSEYREALGRTIAKLYELDYEKVDDVNATTIRNVKSRTIAKKFIYKCKKGIR